MTAIRVQKKRCTCFLYHGEGCELRLVGLLVFASVGSDVLLAFLRDNANVAVATGSKVVEDTFFSINGVCSHVLCA